MQDLEHTKSQRAQKALEIVQARRSEKMMRALAALLKTQVDSDGYVGFSGFYRRLLEEERVLEIPRPVVYGLLSALEREGYIDVDRTGYRHRYKADKATVKRAMQRLLRKAAVAQTKASKELAAELLRLRERRDDMSRYSAMVVAGITRGKSGLEIHFAVDASGVQELVTTRILSRAARDDVVRVHFGEVEQEILSYTGVHLAALLKKGCRVRLLLHAAASEEAKTAFRDFSQSHSKYVDSRALEVRLRTRTDLTYEFIGLNEMGIVLAVATSPPMATYIPRYADERLVSHTIATFDREFEHAMELNEESGGEGTP